MSEVEKFDSESKSEPQEESGASYTPFERPECRDFKRNVCRKGSACKYYHPPRNVGDVLERNSVCHDFQNKRGCNRPSCRYLHLTKEEEDYIREHGVAPPTISPEEMAKLEGLPPLCNDYMQGKCSRGSKCKFRHVGEPGKRTREEASRPEPSYSRYDDLDYGRERQEMRRRYREDMMEDEIMYLRAQVSRLKRQVADLTATNEMLMDENARLQVVRHPRVLSPRPVAKIDSAYSSVRDPVPYSSSLPRAVAAADMYSVAPSHTPMANSYSDSTRSTASGVVYALSMPRN